MNDAGVAFAAKDETGVRAVVAPDVDVMASTPQAVLDRRVGG